jgi:O-antigen ligase
MALTPRTEQPILFWSLVILVCLAPLPFGAVHALSWGPFACVVGVLLTIWSVRVATGRQEAPFGLTRTWFLVAPLFLVVAWIVVQASSVTPQSWHHPLWQSAAETLDLAGIGAISLNPHQSWSTLTRLLAYAGVFWLTLQFCHKSTRARQVLYALAIAGFAYAIYGLISYAVGSETIFWFEKPAADGSLTGTFASRHSYATYAGLGLLSVTGLVQISLTQKAQSLLSQMTRETFTAGGAAARTGRDQPGIPSREGLRRLAASLTPVDYGLMITWCVIFASLIASGSRAGIDSIVFALITLLIVLAVGSVRRRRAAMFAGGFVLVLGAAFLLGGEKLEKHLAGLSADKEQPQVYDLTVSAIQDAPLLGTGYGTFEEVFRFYRTTDIQGYHAMAQSTYLESILELGLPATLLLFALFGGFFYLTIRGIRARGRDVVFPCIGFAATILIAIHVAAGFSLQVPAIAATYAMIMGAACAQCWSTRRPDDPW